MVRSKLKCAIFILLCFTMFLFRLPFPLLSPKDYRCARNADCRLKISPSSVPVSPNSVLVSSKKCVVCIHTPKQCKRGGYLFFIKFITVVREDAKQHLVTVRESAGT